MSLNTKQLKAIRKYSDKGYRPELSAYPMYRFTEKATGKIVSHNIATLCDWYDQETKQEARENAQQKKLEKKP